MTSVDEDLLLHEPEANGYDNLTALDEDLLLGTEDVASKPNQESVGDSVSPLDSSAPIPEQTDDDEEENFEDDHEDRLESEKEELDYDEEEDDEERRERTSRYTSEKKGGARADEGDENKKVAGTKDKRTGIPSLFDKTITNNPMNSGDQLIGVRLRIEGEQERVFYPPPNFMNDVPPQNIVPRLPNGIPLIGMPSNHGRAGFGDGYKEKTRMTGGGGGVPAPAQWDQAVAMFLNGGKTTSRGRTHRKRRSSSYSSSSGSSESRSRSRSSSKSDRRRRGQKERRRDDRDRRDDRRHDRRDERRHDDRRPRQHRDSDRDRDSRRRKEQSKNATIESAKALGLSSEYIDKMNEQKKRREEIVRKKEERRHGVVKESAPAAPVQSITTVAPPTSGKEKPRAYLSVNVCGVQHLPTAVKKIESMATELGPIKKCWRSATDVVSIIFNAHDKAKEFMVNYNGKVLSGMRISVSLEKKFLNPNEVN